MARTSKLEPALRKARVGKIVSAELRKVDNGFVVTGRDDNYNQKEFIAKSEAEAKQMVTRMITGKR